MKIGKLRKVIITAALMLTMGLSSLGGITVNAQELPAISEENVVTQASTDSLITESTETTVVTTNDSTKSILLDNQNERIPNYFVIEAVVDGGSDSFKIIAHNIGVDTIDKIQCTVKVTNTSGQVQYHKIITFTDIAPIFSPTHNIYVKNWKQIEIYNIQAWDGTDYATRPAHTIIRE